MNRSRRLVTASAEETRAVGAAIGGLLGAGDVVALSGDLGAGKTTLVQGVAQALGVDEPVVSPTFTLVREYAGALRVYHVDVYRLDRVQDVLDLGFDEMIDDHGVVLVEWGDAIEALLPESHLQLELEIPHDGDDRTITVTAKGPSWAGRWERLEGLTDAWTVK